MTKPNRTRYLAAKRLPPGRPSSYSELYVDKAYKLCLLGATDKEIAEIFSVTLETLYEWKRSKPAFSDAFMRGRVQADAEVAASLRERAVGYSHKAVKIFMPAGADKPVYADYTEYYPPDTAAASLWLRNRHPDKWREKTDVAVSGQLSLEAWVLESLEAPKKPAPR